MDKKIRTRGALKGQLTRFAKCAKELVDGTDPFEVESRYNLFKELMKKFDTVQSDIEVVLEGEESEEQELERAQFEEEYIRVDSRFRQWLSSKQQVKEQNFVISSPSNPGHARGVVREVSGDAVEFDNDQNVRLTDVNKLYYLKTALRDEALGIVNSLAIIPENYRQALKLLKSRYDNKRCLIQAHLTELFGQSEIKGRSLASLRSLLDCSNKHVASLRALGENVDDWDTVLVFLLTSKLDFETRRNFETEFVNSDITYEEAIAFLQQRCMALERLGSGKTAKPTVKAYTSISAEQKPKGSGKSMRCPVCKKSDHKASDCAEFLGLKTSARFDRVRKLNLCINCLNVGHRAAECKSRKCSKCFKNHNSLLHFENSLSNVIKSEPTANSDSPVVNSTVVGSNFNATGRAQVMLFTLMVKVPDVDGRGILCRALLDTGSQSCFISRACLDRLQLKPSRFDYRVEGVGGNETSITEFIDVTLSSLRQRSIISVKALVLNKITGRLPQRSLDANVAKPFTCLSLADPEWYISNDIDILLSNAVFTRIVKNGIFENQVSGLKAINTSFGWVIGGEAPFSSVLSIYCLCAVQDLSSEMKRFWELDDFPLNNPDVEDSCSEHFEQTVRRLTDGRFSIRLPFKDRSIQLKGSDTYARNRFAGLEARFARDPEFRNSYVEFIEDGLKCGIFERVPLNVLNVSNCYYMPHHGVAKVQSMFTKLRCVFDGSAVPPGSSSINSVLYTGLKQQTDIIRILTEFRGFKVAFVADIERMFCQIEVDPEDRDFLRFFWRPSVDEPLIVLRHCRLPFGLTCSPFIAIRCLHRLADEAREDFPKASWLLKNNMYVDDLIAGADSVDQASVLIEELRRVCASAGFNLRKWASSDQRLAGEINQDDRLVEVLKSNERSVLGVCWNSSNDNFSFQFDGFGATGRTKREILSQLAKLFDPLGWLNPIIVKGKILLQVMWLEKTGWDEHASEEIMAEWNRVVYELPEIRKVSIARFIGDVKERFLCCFVDSSTKAYGACVYLVRNGSSKLMMAKSKVAPLKVVSLARLELCAAVVGARLVHFLMNTLKMLPENCFFWSDSQIVLAWLRRPAHHWKCFVANRVSVIQDLVPQCKWMYVKSKENPADLLSRGMYPAQLIESEFWWIGPPWLTQFDCQLRHRVREVSTFETDSEAKVALHTTVDENFLDRLCIRVSSHRRLLNILAWITRFVNNLRSAASVRNYGFLTLKEVDNALMMIVKRIQMIHFSSAIELLQLKRPLNRNDSLQNLTPMLDAHGVLRVGGRLRNSELCFDKMHPILLPRDHRFVNGLINYYHNQNFHMGANFLMGLIRQRFWIVNARSCIMKVIKKCVICFRYRPRAAVQLQGDLPNDRTLSGRAFQIIGIDLCGPFFVRPNKGRGRTTHKIYVALFICFSVKAVHVETVSDLTTEVFLGALKRFISRRGLPRRIYTDNGRNFIGACRYIQEWRNLLASKEFEQGLGAFSLTQNIEWKFIPPRSPSFGGLWESNIKSFKTCLRKILTKETLAIEEFQTLIIQIENVLNSRPLSNVTNSPDDLDVLTPNHFLVGSRGEGLADTVPDGSMRLGARWRHIQQLLSHFWKRWTDEYLITLQQKYKAQKTYENIKIGDIGVLIREGCPPFVWPLCRVQEIVRGPDGLVRVIEVRVGNSVLKRGINKFCPLPDFT